MMDKPKNSTIINVCIVPNDLISKSFVNISQSLETSETMFVLGGSKFAHMTVFMARFADCDIDKVVKAAELSLIDISKFSCQHSGYLLTEGRYLESSYCKSADIILLHQKMIKNLSPIRINPGMPFEEGYFAPYNDMQRKNAIETGYDLANDLYRPHITLTRYANSIPNRLPIFSKTDLSFDVDKICVYKADDNGAIYELIAAFEV